MITDLPANVTFEPNADGFVLDQDADVIKSVQAFVGSDGTFIVELWGNTTVVTPGGRREEGRRFQQNEDMKFDGHDGFTWEVRRFVYDESHSVDQAIPFKVSGRRENVSEYRRI